MKIKTEKIRITVISESLVRIEYSQDGIFNDCETLFASNRNAETENARYKVSGNVHELTTDYFHLTYCDNGDAPTEKNLYADICGFEWHYGEENKNNLGGALSTLDYISPDKPVENGILSRDGWFVIDDSGKALLKDNWIAKNTFKNNTDIYLFAYGNDYKRAFSDLRLISGCAQLPRKYIFGSWYSRWWPYTDEEIKEIVKGYDEHDFPLDIMVLDMDWHYHDWQMQTEEDEKYRADYGYGHADNLGWTGYTWNRRLIKNPEKLLADLHSDNIYVTLNDHPADGIRTNEEWYERFANLMGFPPESRLNLEFDCSDKRYMENSFKAVHEQLEKQGVDFWWVDWQQNSVKPFVKGIRGLRHLPWLNCCYYEHSKNGGNRGISFSRWGGWGDQKHPICFSGDTLSDWSILEYEVKFTITSSNAGCFFWGHDTGGFYGDRNAEMYVRWTQFTAFSACLRVHSQRDELLDRRPWLWGEEAENAMKKMYHLRSRLIPYIYSSAYTCYESGLPLIRGMYIEYPDEEAAYKFNTQYMFGDAFIVSPITEPGEGKSMAVSKKVWLPCGVYYNIFSGERYDGNRAYDITSDINLFPAFVKGGVPIPMQPYSRRMTSEALNTLVIRIYPGENGEFTLYEDDGISENFKSGDFLKTKISYAKSENVSKISVMPYGKGYDKMPDSRCFVIELPLTGSIDVKGGRKVYDGGMNKIFIDNKNIFDCFDITFEEIV